MPLQTNRVLPEYLSSFLEGADIHPITDIGSPSTIDPLGNDVRSLAFDLSAHLKDGSLAISEIAALVRTICDRAIAARVERSFSDGRLSARTPREIALSMVRQDKTLTDTTFLTRMARAKGGIVFTAHPTFALSVDVRKAMSAYAVQRDRSSFDEEMKTISHRVPSDINLDQEHQEALVCIEHAKTANREVITALLEAIDAERPQLSKQAVVAPTTIATWIGYDLDGRTDIHWAKTFQFRLTEKAQQLGDYATQLQQLPTRSQELAGLEEKLRRASSHANEQAKLFDGDLTDPETVVQAANFLTQDHPDRIVSLGEIDEALLLEISKADDQTSVALRVLRSEMKLYGLGVARIHLRVNAAQVRSALGSDLGRETLGDFLDRTALNAAAEKAKALSDENRAKNGVRTPQINFSSVFREKMTARRQFMLCAQFLKHVDSDTPIRFLIAESEAPATIMGAIYLARLYGVADKIDISPLFETPDAIESGGRFLERLFDQPEFIDYIRDRGRISIQLGFSDSGRFMGQFPANLAIERLQILLAREMGAHGLHDVEALIFNTHGESMGRGGYPGALFDRFDHLATPWSRARFKKEEVPLCTEVSFQGGDGFLYFSNKQLARRTLLSFVDWTETDVTNKADEFYSDINFSWDVYRAAKAWQEALFDMDDCQIMLGALGPGMIYKTGSRPARRQSGASAEDVARSLRAIPHNAIFQQLAIPANVAGGIGTASLKEVDRFKLMVEKSARMGRIWGLASQAQALTSVRVLRAYASLYDPSLWTVWAKRSENPYEAATCDRIADAALRTRLNPAIEHLANHLSKDRRRFEHALHELGGGPIDDLPPELEFLHALRIAVMMFGVQLTAACPSFTDRHGVTIDDLIAMALRLEFRSVAEKVESIFPPDANESASFAGLTEVSSEEPPTGYMDIRKNVSEPLIELDHVLKEISCAIHQFYGAYG